MKMTFFKTLLINAICIIISIIIKDILNLEVFVLLAGLDFNKIEEQILEKIKNFNKK